MSVEAFRARLLDVVENGTGVPSRSTIYAEWYSLRGYGPRSDRLVAATARILGCTSEDLLCSKKQNHSKPA